MFTEYAGSQGHFHRTRYFLLIFLVSRKLLSKVRIEKSHFQNIGTSTVENVDASKLLNSLVYLKDCNLIKIDLWEKPLSYE